MTHLEWLHEMLFHYKAIVLETFLINYTQTHEHKILQSLVHLICISQIASHLIE